MANKKNSIKRNKRNLKQLKIQLMANCRRLTSNLKNSENTDRNGTHSINKFTPARRSKWLSLISREDLMNKPPRSYAVCEEHFDVVNILAGTHRKKLKTSSLPSLHLPDFQKKDVQTTTEAATLVEICTQTEDRVKRERYYGEKKTLRPRQSLNTSGSGPALPTARATTSTESKERKKRDQTQTPVSAPIHGVDCTFCENTIVGHRYKCLQCMDVNLCTSCESAGCHGDHCVLRLPNPRIYNTVMSCLGPLKNALNASVSYTQRREETNPKINAEIFGAEEEEHEEEEEPMIVVGAAAECSDPLIEPKTEIVYDPETEEIEYDKDPTEEAISNTSANQTAVQIVRSSTAPNIISIAFERSFAPEQNIQLPSQREVTKRKMGTSKMESVAKISKDTATSGILRQCLTSQDAREILRQRLNPESGVRPGPSTALKLTPKLAQQTETQVDIKTEPDEEEDDYFVEYGSHG